MSRPAGSANRSSAVRTSACRPRRAAVSENENTMTILRSTLGLFVVAGALLAAAPPRVDAGQGPAARGSCSASRDRPVAICFAQKPLTLRRCLWRAIPDFTVDVWHAPGTPDVGYRFSYRL